MKKLGIIIVTNNRPELLKKCLDSILRQKNSNYEVNIIFNGEDISETIRQLYPKFNYYTCVKQTPGSARNIVMNVTVCDWFVFLDDDVYLPENYFDLGCSKISDDLDVFGGPDQSSESSSTFQFAIGEALRSSLVTWKTSVRHKRVLEKKANEYDLSLCNLWVKSEVLKKHNITFNEFYQRNEENVLLSELLKKEANIHYFPDLNVFHERKKSFKNLISSISSSGFHRVISQAKKDVDFDMVFFVPLLFIFSGTLLLVLNWYYLMQLLFAYFLIITFYLILTINRKTLLLLVLILHPVFHVSYGVGSFLGILKLIVSKFRRKVD